MRLERVLRPWAWDGTDTLDSLEMESRDRLVNLAIFAAAGVVWLLVGLIVTTRDPIADPVAGFIGASLIGLAVVLTTTSFAWLLVFGPHRRIAYQGDWSRAARRVGRVRLVAAI